MAANLKFLYWFKLALLTSFESKNSFELSTSKWLVSKANFNTGKRIYNWLPFMKVVYKHDEKFSIFLWLSS